ncbi:MAG: cobT 2 [Firmicutes bacterium]|nr:cobT 2 [Bacillota bacterium]
MEFLADTLVKIAPLDKSAIAIAEKRLDSLPNLAKNLGRLKNMVMQYIGITGKIQPAIPRKNMILACADHGVAELGLSAYPVETTFQMAKNYLISQGAGANAMAKFAGADIMVVDMGINHDMSDVPGLIHHKIAWGTKNFTQGPAMRRVEAVLAIETGIKIVNDQVEHGYRCFSLGEMGIANTTASACIAAVLAGLSPEEATGRGTGISDSRLKIKIEAVRQALAVNKPEPDDAIDILAKVGGFEIGALAGVILGAAANRCMVVVDGFNASAAALIANSLHPLVKSYMLASHLSAEPAHGNMLDTLGIKPCIDMGLRLGEGSGASLAMNLLDVAIKIYNKVATQNEDLYENGKSLLTIEEGKRARRYNTRDQIT